MSSEMACVKIVMVFVYLSFLCSEAAEKPLWPGFYLYNDDKIFVWKDDSVSYSHIPSPKTPVFSDQYIVNGVLHIPYSEIEEPFYAWYDKSNSASRIDYYGGMVKTYQFSNVTEYGQMLKIAPITTETVLNADTCMQLNGTESMQISSQSVLPDMEKFQYKGEEYVKGISAEKWQYIESVADRQNKYTMFVHYKKSIVNPNENIPIPILFIMKGFNIVFGSHYDHYWINYENYSDEKPDSSVFEVNNMVCESFPGPGLDHFYTFNPMKEYVGREKGYMDDSFEDFIRKHNKQYDGRNGLAYRKEIFRQNLRYIHSKNRANPGFTLKPNHLADKTASELKALRGRRYTEGYNGGKPFSHDYTLDDTKKIPANYDWRIYGAVTPVKDQSVCGSCWSFGTTGAVEGAYFVKNHHLLQFSQQALIDCSWGFGNNGCDGGEDFRAYKWIMKHGIPTEESYGPYYGQDAYCHVNNVTERTKITSFVNVTANDENALKMALLKKGPISISIDASPRSFAFYSNGVYFEPTCKNKMDELDHSVLLVGYGKWKDDEPYWLVKNSWSTYWGNDGYILMSLKDNNCGVMTAPTYVEF